MTCDVFPFRFDWTLNINAIHVDVSSPYLLVTPGHSHTAALLDTNCCSSNLTGRQLARSLSGMQRVYALWAWCTCSSCSWSAAPAACAPLSVGIWSSCTHALVIHAVSAPTQCSHTSRLDLGSFRASGPHTLASANCSAHTTGHSLLSYSPHWQLEYTLFLHTLVTSTCTHTCTHAVTKYPSIHHLSYVLHTCS